MTCAPEAWRSSIAGQNGSPHALVRRVPDKVDPGVLCGNSQHDFRRLVGTAIVDHDDPGYERRNTANHIFDLPFGAVSRNDNGNLQRGG